MLEIDNKIYPHPKYQSLDGVNYIKGLEMKININEKHYIKNEYYQRNPSIFMEIVKIVNKRNYSKYIRNRKHIYDWIMEQTNDITGEEYTLWTRLYRIIYDIHGIVRCPVCGGEIKNVYRLWKGYGSRCSVTCMNKDNEHIKRCLNTISSYIQDDPEYYHKRFIKSINTKIRNGHEWNWTNLEKNRQTKARNHNGDENWNNINKARETRYKTNGGNWHSDEYVQKCQETSLKNNGFKCVFSVPELRKQWEKESIRKASETRKRNKTYKKSKLEDKIYSYIIQYFPQNDIVRQYKDEMRYPYFCDFYIKSIDLFIEVNGHWTHGFHPFDKINKKDIQIVNTWKSKFDDSKKHDFYKTAVYVWTKLDVTKRATAIKNKINFIELWNYDQAVQFINSIINIQDIRINEK